MRKPLFNHQPPSCGYCLHGKSSPDGKTVLCPKRGVTHAGMACKKYVYDPLRRAPKPIPKMPVFTPEDFET